MKRKGLPRELEREVYEALVPILKKYKDMKKSHLSNDRIHCIADITLRQVCAEVLWGVSTTKSIK